MCYLRHMKVALFQLLATKTFSLQGDKRNVPVTKDVVEARKVGGAGVIEP